MKSPAQIIRWLKSNLGPKCCAGLTSTDTVALVTSVNLCNLISYDSAPQNLFSAYAAIVRAMQPHNRWLAYHAIACELDWSHRAMIWANCELEPSDVRGKCAYEH